MKEHGQEVRDINSWDRERHCQAELKQALPVYGMQWAADRIIVWSPWRCELAAAYTGGDGSSIGRNKREWERKRELWRVSTAECGSVRCG